MKNKKPEFKKYNEDLEEERKQLEEENKRESDSGLKNQI